MTRKELSILLTLAAVQFTHIMDGMIMMPMAPSIREAFHISTQEFGFLVSSYGIAAFISAIAATFWIDRFDRKKALLVLYVGFLLGTFACSMAPDYNYFLLARTLTGFFGGIAAAVIQSIVGDVIAPQRRAQGMGILMTGFALASVVGIPMGIFLSEQLSWQAPFLMICAVGLPVLAMITLLIPPVNAHLTRVGEAKQSTTALYSSLWRNPAQRLAILLSFTTVWAHAAIIPFISDYLVNNLGYVMDSQIIFMYVVGGVLTTVCSPLIGRIADKVGRFKVFVVLSLLASIPIYLISNQETRSMTLLLVEGGMFFIFSGGRMIPTSAIVTGAVEPAMRGRFMSLVSAFQQLGMGVSTLVGGLIIVNAPDGKLVNYPIVGYIGIGLSVLAVIWGARLKEPKVETMAAN